MRGTSPQITSPREPSSEMKSPSFTVWPDWVVKSFRP
jgi:hypothetical protein